LLAHAATDKSDGDHSRQEDGSPETSLANSDDAATRHSTYWHEDCQKLGSGRINHLEEKEEHFWNQLIERLDNQEHGGYNDLKSVYLLKIFKHMNSDITLSSSFCCHITQT
jgi:hypothetical protein